MNMLKISGLALSIGLLATSCNKDVKQFDQLPTFTAATGDRIATVLSKSPNDSLYYRMVLRSGLTSLLNDSSRSFTLFSTDNAGMRLFVNQASQGFIPLAAPDATHSQFLSGTLTGFPGGGLPVASAQGIVSYNLAGQRYTAAEIPNTFPNINLPTQITLDPTLPFVRAQIFPSKAAPVPFVNSLPLISTDLLAANGVIHRAFSVVTPPTTTMKGLANANPLPGVLVDSLDWFRAAVQRADSGAVGLNKIDSLMSFGLTNLTVLAPNNQAFRDFIYNLVYARVFIQTNSALIAAANAAGAVAVGPNLLLSGAVTTAEVKGVLAYHIFAAQNAAGVFQPTIRVFSNNVPVSATPRLITTLVNTSVANHPGVAAFTTSTTPPFISSFTFRSFGNFPTSYSGTTPPLTPVFGAPFTGPASNAVVRDRLAVNGVLHIVDRVLLPLNLP